MLPHRYIDTKINRNLYEDTLATQIIFDAFWGKSTPIVVVGKTYVLVDSSWREASNSYVLVNGAWREVVETNVCINGTWHGI